MELLMLIVLFAVILAVSFAALNFYLVKKREERVLSSTDLNFRRNFRQMRYFSVKRKAEARLFYVLFPFINCAKLLVA